MSVSFKDWPETVIVTCAMFAVIPLWSLMVIELPWQIAEDRGALAAYLAAFVYWIGPTVSLALLLLRHRLLVPWYTTHCALLGIYILLVSAARPFWVNAVESSVIIIMAISGVLLLNDDVLYPFIADNPHAWRKAPRLMTNKLLKIINIESGNACHVIVADASLTGMGLYGANAQLTEALAGTKNGDYCELVMGTGKTAHVLDAKIKWTKIEDSRVMALGVEALDPKSMGRFLRGLTPISMGGRLSHQFAKHWVQPKFRYGLLALWVGSFLMTHMFPAYAPAMPKQVVSRDVSDGSLPVITGH